MHERRWWMVALVLGCLGSLLLSGGGGAQRVSARGSFAPAEMMTASGGGPIQSTFTISDESPDEVNPAMAYNPDAEVYVVVWFNDLPGNDDIHMRAVSKEGELLWGPLCVACGQGADRRYPDVAYSTHDDEYLVVWQDYNHTSKDTTIRGRRISWTGQFITQEFEIFGYDPSQSPAVAYASTEEKFLIVWEWFDLSGYHIMGRTYASTSGLGATEFISQDPGGSARSQPGLAYCRTRNEYLAVWRADNDIYARRVAGDGTPLAPASITISSLGHDESVPSVGALPVTPGEGDYLVAWEINTGSETGIDGKTVHVANDGSVTVGVLPGVIYDSSEDESTPAVAGNENTQQYLVTWTQHYAPTGGGVGIVYDGIAGRTISKDGEILNGTLMDPGTFIAGWGADHSAVVAGSMGDFLVVYDDLLLGDSDVNIYGHLWGNRVYLPLIVRN